MHPYAEARRSRRISKQLAVPYDSQGWESVDIAHLKTAILEAPSPASSSSSYASSPSPRRPSKQTHVPRPPNAFMLFRSEFWKQNKGVIAQRDHREISKMCGIQWNALPASDKVRYKVLAQAEKERHLLRYPDYKYTPASRAAKAQRKKLKRDKEGEEVRCRNLAAMMMRDVQGAEEVRHCVERDLEPIEGHNGHSPLSSTSSAPSDLHYAYEGYVTQFRSSATSPTQYVAYEEPALHFEEQRYSEPDFVPTELIPALDLDTHAFSLSNPFTSHAPILASGNDPTLCQVSSSSSAPYSASSYTPTREFAEPAPIPVTYYSYDTREPLSPDYFNTSSYGELVPYTFSDDSFQQFDSTDSNAWLYDTAGLSQTEDYGAVITASSSPSELHFAFSYAHSTKLEL